MINSKNKLIVFDFDGVLADSFSNLYTINKLSAEFVNRKISEEDYIKMFSGKFHHNLYNFLDLNEEELNKYLEYKYKIFNKYYIGANLFSFAPDLIKRLSLTASLAIVSSAPEEAIRRMLEKYGLVDNFFMILGMNKSGKILNLKKCITKAKGIDENSFFITDTVGDIIDGKEAGLKTIAVTWGFHSDNILEKINPNFIVNDYREIIKIISK